MEIGRFGGNPGHELPDCLMAKQRLDGGIAARQLAVGEIGVDRPMADGVDWLPFAPAPAFGDWMVPFDPLAHRPRA